MDTPASSPAMIDLPAVIRILAVEQFTTATRWADHWSNGELPPDMIEASKRLWTLAIVAATDGRYDSAVGALESASTVDRLTNAGDVMALAAIEVVRLVAARSL